mmetsp:Transcript_39516/g.91503  ORF Transcript_39516/g.91503 Transcript_39516/m.91503 type:complete len:311 (-) Transcript_39516:125-1057(-)
MYRRLMGGVKYSGKLRPGVRSAARPVPEHIPRPDYAADGVPRHGCLSVSAKEGPLIDAMREASRVSREVLDCAVSAARAGVTTDEIDAVVHLEAIRRGAYPSPLGYRGFPKACATSVNEVICHGIPDSTVLQDGDIVNIDVSCFYGGGHGDLSEMVMIGDVDAAAKALLRDTYDSLHAAIGICGPGVPYAEIGRTIEEHVKPRGYTIVKQFCGHGIGQVFHEPPNVLHYSPGPVLASKARMELGHTFTIEPMINQGAVGCLEWDDDWTVTTTDGKRSAQFEHTLLVTEDGVDVLTKRTANSQRFWWEEAS